jgi:hypothetical protein
MSNSISDWQNTTPCSCLYDLVRNMHRLRSMNADKCSCHQALHPLVSDGSVSRRIMATICHTCGPQSNTALDALQHTRITPTCRSSTCYAV